MPNAKELWRCFQEEEGSSPRARRSFIGRLDARQAYYALALQALNEAFRGCYIIHYHGIGGIGKSTLLRQLEQELLEERETPPSDPAGELCLAIREAMGKKKKPVVLRADFDDASLSAPQDVLTRLRAQVMDQAGNAMFPLFDLALTRLSQKYGRRVPPDEQKAALTGDPVVSFALDVVGDLTGAGLFIKAGQTAIEVAQGVARTLSGRKGCIRRANTEIARMEAPELLRHLPYYFAMDLNAMDLPLVCVYLDTYEKMISRAEGAGRSTGFDEEWLWGERGLVKNLGNAVFAIAGREPLESGRLGVNPRQVSEFSDQESITFLTSCGIDDAGLRRELCELTTGNPLYLDLCVDEYEHLSADSPKILSAKDFGATSSRLAERYLRYVRPELQDGVRMLCRMGQWTDGLYSPLSRRLPQLPREGETAYNDLIHLTYIERVGQGWRVKRAVADVLGQELSGALFRRLTEALAGIADQETHRLQERNADYAADGTALDILFGMTKDAANAPAAGAMAARADAYVGLCQLDKARLWQERAMEQWKRLGDKPMCLAGAERLAGILNDMALFRERDDALRAGLALAEELGTDAPVEQTLRLWERRAGFSATWEEDAYARKKVVEQLQKQGQGARPLWMAQCRFARSLMECDEPENMGLARDTADGRVQAQALLEEAFQKLQQLNQSDYRNLSPYTLLAAEMLCRLLEETEQTQRLEEIQARMRRCLPYVIPEAEPLEELQIWQEWLDMAMERKHQQHCGLDMSGMFELQRQVMLGLRRHLGEQHPQTLLACRRTVETYLDSRQSLVIASNIDELGAQLAAALDPDTPIGSIKKTGLTFFEDPENMTGCCEDLVKLYTLYLGREHPAVFEVMDLLYRTYDLAGQYDKAAACRLGAREIFGRLRPDLQERLRAAKYVNRMEGGLVDDYERLEQWELAVGVQRQILAQREIQGGDTAAAGKRLLELYLEWLWQEEALSAQEAEELLRAILEQCGTLSGWDARPYLSSARQWCLAHEDQAETEAWEAVAAAWRENGGWDEETF